MSGGAHFYINRDVDKKNLYCYWACKIHQQDLHWHKVTVSCATSSSRIIGLYFLKRMVKRKQLMLRTTFKCHKFFIYLKLKKNWFQQYAETSHMARISMEIFLEKAFQTDSFLEIVRFHGQIIFVVLQVQNVCE